MVEKDEFGLILEKLRKTQAAMRVCVRAIQDARNRAWEWRDQRDELRSQTPTVHNEISEIRMARDELNAEVQHQKKLRDEETERARVLQEKFNELRRERGDQQEHLSFDELQHRFRELEWKQQTSSLTIEEERILLDEMEYTSKAMEQARENQHQSLNHNEEMDNLWDEIQEARNKAQEHHEKMQALVDKAQQQHQSIINLSHSLGPTRTEVEEAHQMYVKCLQEADEMRERFDELQRQEIDLKSQLDAIRKDRKSARQEREKVAMEKLAEQARVKQQNGQKLTMEELRALMEADGLK
ncbi:MAG: coiled-coil protein [Candidatus Thorarchaeota archaeon]